MLTTDIFGKNELTGKPGLLLERSHAKGGGAINPELQTALDAVTAYNTLLVEARFAYWKAIHAIRGVEHADYDPLFAGWQR